VNLRTIKAQAVVAADCIYSLKFLRLWLQSHCYFATRFLLSGFIQKAIVALTYGCHRFSLVFAPGSIVDAIEFTIQFIYLKKAKIFLLITIMKSASRSNEVA
jgi:hypothetical protein